MSATVAAVRAIFSSRNMADASIQSAIDTADVIVDDRLSGAGLATTTLDQIRLYLSAHICCVHKPRQASRSLGRASESYEGVPGGLFLQSTRYGQMVLMLDTSGILSKLQSGDMEASMSYAGSDTEDDE